MEDLIARTSVFINASRQSVWTVLVAPDTVTRIIAVTEVIAPWRVGERFTWAFQLQGQRTLVEGLVHRMDEGRLIEYEFADPHSRDVLHRENVHRVSIALSDEGTGTRVALTQDANLNRVAQAHAEGGWRLALNHLRGLVEQQEAVSSPPR